MKVPTLYVQAIFDSTATVLADGLFERGCFNTKGGCTDSTSKSYIEAVSNHTASPCVRDHIPVY